MGSINLMWRGLGALALAAMGGCGGGADEPEGMQRPLAASPPAAVIASTRPAEPSASELFDWAETQYPTLFEVGPQTGVADYAGRSFQYRYYPGSNSYLGVTGGEVFGLGAFTGEQLQGLGRVGDFACQVFPETCAGTAIGTLTLSGPDLARAGGGGSFVPVGTATTSETPSRCVTINQQTTCTSQLAIGWSESNAERMVVILSSSYPDRGVAPGYGVNGIDLAYSVFGAFGVSQICTRNPAAGTDCDFAALGIRLNLRARTLSFNNTPGPIPGGGSVLINGTLSY